MSDNDQVRYPRKTRFHGGTLMIAIPPQLYKALGWAQGSWLAVRREGNEVVLSHLHLGQSNERGEDHRLIPKGKHGARFQPSQLTEKR